MEGFLEQLNLQKDELVEYDPQKVTSKKILENKKSSYECTTRPGMENIANKDNQEEVENILKVTSESSYPGQVAGKKGGE